MNIFERATRNHLRFASPKGELTTEQVFDLPLTGDGTDLDSIARAVNSELKSIDEGSFVERTPDPRKRQLALQLDILKHVIASKLEDEERANKAMASKARRAKLLAALEAKEADEMAGMSREEIIAELGDADLAEA